MQPYIAVLLGYWGVVKRVKPPYGHRSHSGPPHTIAVKNVNSVCILFISFWFYKISTISLISTHVNPIVFSVLLFRVKIFGIVITFL